jgi:hypothetical protein
MKLLSNFFRYMFTVFLIMGTCYSSGSPMFISLGDVDVVDSPQDRPPLVFAPIVGVSHHDSPSDYVNKVGQFTPLKDFSDPYNTVAQIYPNIIEPFLPSGLPSATTRYLVEFSKFVIRSRDQLDQLFTDFVVLSPTASLSSSPDSEEVSSVDVSPELGAKTPQKGFFSGLGAKLKTAAVAVRAKLSPSKGDSPVESIDFRAQIQACMQSLQDTERGLARVTQYRFFLPQNFENMSHLNMQLRTFICEKVQFIDNNVASFSPSRRAEFVAALRAMCDSIIEDFFAVEKAFIPVLVTDFGYQALTPTGLDNFCHQMEAAVDNLIFSYSHPYEATIQALEGCDSCKSRPEVLTLREILNRYSSFAAEIKGPSQATLAYWMPVFNNIAIWVDTRRKEILSTMRGVLSPGIDGEVGFPNRDLQEMQDLIVANRAIPGAWCAACTGHLGNFDEIKQYAVTHILEQPLNEGLFSARNLLLPAGVTPVDVKTSYQQLLRVEAARDGAREGRAGVLVVDGGGEV